MPHYLAEFEFYDREHTVHSTKIMVESPDDKAVVEDIRRWMKRRQECVPEWFTTYLAVKIHGFFIGRVDEKGSIDPGIRHRVYEWKIDHDTNPYGT